MFKKIVSQFNRFKYRKKFACILPWVHIQSDTSGNLFPCCVSDRNSPLGSVFKQTTQEIWNSEGAKEMRRQLQSGQIPKACKQCDVRHQRNSKSYRQQALNIYSDQLHLLDSTSPDGYVDFKNLQILELRFSNICNFKCRTCDDVQSSGWYQDAKSLGMASPLKVFDSEAMQKNIDSVTAEILPNLKEIHFSGGEVLIQREHYKFLEKLIATGRTDIKLAYNTNLSFLTFQEWDAIKLWNQFDSVRILASLDGWGEPGELVRKGLKTEVFEANFRRLLTETTSAELLIHMTVSAINIFHITEAINQLLIRGLVGDSPRKAIFEIGLVNSPRHYDINILNLKERDKVRQHYKSFIEELKTRESSKIVKKVEKELQCVLNYFSDEILLNERVKFRTMTFKVDHLREERFIKHFPEHFSLLYEN